MITPSRIRFHPFRPRNRFLTCFVENPSPQPPPRNGEGEKKRRRLACSPSPRRGGGWGEGFSTKQFLTKFIDNPGRRNLPGTFRRVPTGHIVPHPFATVKRFSSTALLLVAEAVAVYDKR